MPTKSIVHYIMHISSQNLLLWLIQNGTVFNPRFSEVRVAQYLFVRGECCRSLFVYLSFFRANIFEKDQYDFTCRKINIQNILIFFICSAIRGER